MRSLQVIRDPAIPAHLALAILICAISLTPAHAGQVNITKCNPGSSARVYWNDGLGVSGTSTTDVNGDGDMLDVGETVTIPNQNSVVTVVVCKDLGFDGNGEGITTWTEHFLKPITLALAEPYSVPTFSPVPTPPGRRLAPMIDVPGFKASGTTFHSGQVITITDGTIPQTSTIKFKDVQGVPNEMITQLFDEAFRNSLPNYNGDVVVDGPDFLRVTAVTPIPGHSVMSLEIWPNPFLGRGEIVFDIVEPGDIDLTVFGVDGRAVRVLERNRVEPGLNRAAWDGKDDRGNPVPSGLYLARLKTSKGKLTRSILYMR